MRFTHLHVHSHYSLLDGLPKIDALLERARELGMDSLALTDHGVMYGTLEFYKKAKKKGIKPIIGCEVYIAYEKMTDKRPNIDNKKYHLILLAKNKTGYQNLIKLVTLSYLEGFYYKPRIDEETLARHADGLIAMTSCLQGKIPRLITAGKYDEAKNQALWYRKIFGEDNFYLELQHHPNIPEQKKVNEAIIQISKETGIPLAAACDSHYLRPEDADAQDILMLINTGADPKDPERLTMKEDDFSMQPPEKMAEFFKDTPEAIENTAKIADACNLELELGKAQLPYFEVPDNKSADAYLRELCFGGLKSKYDFPGDINPPTFPRGIEPRGKDLKPPFIPAARPQGILEGGGINPKSQIPNPNQIQNPNDQKQILERLEYELSVIKQTGFAPYFLIVQDFVNWAKSNGIIVGPGRGSAAGSIVSYLLNITNINPLQYNLLFERFLNPERIAGLPDIDLDFTDTRRDEVIKYVRQKYGEDRVAQIITFGTMMARQVIRDVGRALGYTYGYCDQLAKIIPFNHSLDDCLEKIPEFRQAYEQDAQAKKLIDLAKKLEGVARHASTHACGVVIAKEPLQNLIPCQNASQDNKTLITQYDMISVEDMGLLKMDFLGLKNLTIMENAIKLIEAKHGVQIALDKIPPDDKKTFDLLKKGDCVGVFQFESGGMRKNLRELKPTEFEDLIAMVALFRPGPIELIPRYIARKHGRETIEYAHPDLEPILRKTYGIAVYQEQVLEIARKIAGFSLGEADILRKAIGKKIKELLKDQHDKFIGGAVKNGIHKITAERIFQFIEPFAGYAFNRSHSACYALIGYQTAYLKANFPLAFMTALLQSEQKDIDRITILVNECKKMGITILPPDINESDENFTAIEPNFIRFGLTAIKNVGHNVVEAIVSERKAAGAFKNMEDLVTRIESKDLNKKSLEALVKCGTLDKFQDRGEILDSLETLLNLSREIKKFKSAGQASLFDFGFTPAKPLAAPVNSNYSKQDKLRWEKELLGLYVSEHPLEEWRERIEKLASPLRGLTLESAGKKIRIAGMVEKIKKIITKSGKPMLFVEVEDLTDKIEVLVFPRTLEQNPTFFKEGAVLTFSGTVSDKEGNLKLLCDEVGKIA